MADLSLVVLPRSRELGLLMEEHNLKKTILTCAHLTASAPALALHLELLRVAGSNGPSCRRRRCARC